MSPPRRGGPRANPEPSSKIFADDQAAQTKTKATRSVPLAASEPLVLFEEYPHVRRSLRRRRAARPDSVAVVVDANWRGVSDKTLGVVHCIRIGVAPEPFGGIKSVCGLYVAARSLVVGEVVQGCAVCIAAGAPAVRA